MQGLDFTASNISNERLNVALAFSNSLLDKQIYKSVFIF